jgi:adenine-specific DNA-methyltransferase
MTKKINLTSENIKEDRIDLLKQLFPEVIAENQIDWEKLRKTLGEDLDINGEKFNFTWAGKSKAIKAVIEPSKATLKPSKDEGIKFDESENIFIEGDNLEVLKLLQKAYFEKVKMIYIDPPYNTGGDFVYKDDFKSPIENYLKQTGQKNGESEKLTTNAETNGRFHSDWLTMMYPRLKLAWNLLKHDGIIFVSIDDNELYHLKCVMDEIFGEENYLGTACRVAKKTNNKGDYWSPNFDYILTYSKSVSDAKPFSGGINEEAYNLVDSDGPRKGEKYQLVRLYMSNIQNRNPEQRFYIDCPDGSKIIPPGKTFPPERPELGDGIWRWTRTKFEKERDRIVVKKVSSSNLLDENRLPAKWNVYTKTYLNDVIANNSAKPNSLVEDFINQVGTHELKLLDLPFDYPKPSPLIRFLMTIAQVKNSDIVLDFFAGSGTTAQAVLEQNKEDGEKRTFIAVQIPEPTKVEGEANKTGYKTIADITKERIRRVIKGYGDNPQAIDDGFKVFKLDKSNYPENNFDYDPEKSEEENQKAFKSYLDKAGQLHLLESTNDLDVVYENIVKEGLSLNSKVTKTQLGSNNIYTISDGEQSLYICLEVNVSPETIKVLTSLQYKNKVFICLDSAVNDSAKANLSLNLDLKTI